MYDTYYFDRDEEDVLHDAWLMALRQDYSETEMKALREIILSETRFGLRAVDRDGYQEEE